MSGLRQTDPAAPLPVCQMAEFSQYIPSIMLARSGSVFYSGRKAFEGEKDFYFLGLNPGGAPGGEGLPCVALQVHESVMRTECWSAFTCEQWGARETGQAPIQLRVAHLMRKLNLDPKATPASNLIFLRSRNFVDLERPAELAAECWAFHSRVMEILKVKMIVCFGRWCGAWVREKLGASERIGSFTEKNRRTWVSEVYMSKVTGMKVAILTHPSRANWCSNTCDPSPMITQCMASI